MVNLVKKWTDFEVYAQGCRVGAFQLGDDVDGKRIRVMAGRMAYKHVYQNESDEELQRVLRFCRASGFIEVVGAVPDEQFFSG